MTTNEQSKKWLTKAQIAKHLNCCLRTVTNLMNARVLPYVKIGRLVRFDPVECDAAMEKFKRKSQALQTSASGTAPPLGVATTRTCGAARRDAVAKTTKLKTAK